jgi:hypothetical protein
VVGSRAAAAAAAVASGWVSACLDKDAAQTQLYCTERKKEKERKKERQWRMTLCGKRGKSRG